MAIEPVFTGLGSACEALREAFASLALTAIEDRPEEGAVLLVERLGDAVERLRGWTEEAVCVAGVARAAVAHPPNFYQARAALGQAHELLIRLEYGFSGEAAGPKMVEGLRRFGRERGGEWQSWARGMEAALEGCRPVLRALAEALAGAWMEFSERLMARSISVQNINAGRLVAAAAGGAGP
jgi:hypothetical protein